ncbi:hypothetical protein C5167_042875 [Papaver somniferum]|uniref:Uncharacterized protein n=1 Tax=Papaver somniferum TaxID=3469 RepID=A0A4Y7L534_PAPSO|nr:hypothetical protein C5167_042875 [Papaver somniferum]
MEIQELQNRQPQERVLNCNQFAIQRSKVKGCEGPNENVAPDRKIKHQWHTAWRNKHVNKERGKKKLFDHQKNRQQYRSN